MLHSALKAGLWDFILILFFDDVQDIFRRCTN